MLNIFKSKDINEIPVPNHVGIIMDGNGRWAKKQGKPRVFGHKAGMDSLQRAAIHGQKMGIKVMTVYAFSTENWSRPEAEVKFIMSLPIDFYEKFVPVLNKENIQIRMIGERDGVPKSTIDAIDRASIDTKDNTGMILNFALNYGGRNEITLAVKKIAQSINDGIITVNDITEEMIADNLETSILPKEYQDPDFIIRTSGEERLSNFLPWQAAYSELYFTDVLWPDFDEAELEKAVEIYKKRDRRYGGLK
ncbi:isoprenyl transferase [Floricoccus penangensis]|uniref:Isoprenyl transferase n=1 Tax=Floricoccus penangensis TaxID=1859475 RepID=A0A9Q5JGK8_9LACT|nr:isoprenyl transferase [Floricoccus penangensis]OFI47003.1 isoprenyl transferase [Floricoccus penangensis]